MKRNSFSQKTISVLLSALMVITMIPVFVFSVSAEEPAEATLPAQVSGEWEHKLVPEGQDYAGWGEYYISMWVKNTDFVFMQTKENESFKLSFEFWAMKNDGVNSATIKNTNVRGINFTNAYWTSLTPSLAGDTPDGTGLPGSLGTGHSSQLSKNLVKWQYTGEFTCNAPATRTANLNVEYKSGAASTNTKSHSLFGDGEEVAFNITIVNLRELLTKLEAAEEVYATDSEFSAEEKAELKAVIDNIKDNYTLDGTVAYTQEEIDGLCADLESVLGADLEAYKDAVARAESFVNNEYISDELKAPVNELLAQKDTILSMTKHQQDRIDAATDALNEAVTNAVIASSVQMNGINPAQPSGTGVFRFDSTADDGGSNDDHDKDSVYVTLNYADIYMDKSESFSNMGLVASYGSNFSNVMQFAAPIINSNATGSKIIGEDNKYNFNQYFNNGDPTTSSKDEVTSGNGQYNRYKDYTLNVGGTPTDKALQDGSGADGVKVYVGAWWHQYKAGWFGGHEYDYYSTNEGNSKSQYFYTANSNPIEDQPHFTLHVYDKSALGEALNEAIWVTNNGAANFDEFESLLDNAKNIYGTRVTTQAQIDAAVDAINNFVFEYSVDTVVGSGEGTFTKTLVSGEELANGNYTYGSVVTVTAVPGADYDFVSWDNGVMTTSFTYTVNECAVFTADFVFVPANTENLENTIEDILAEIDTSKYSDETVEALEEAIAEARELIDSNPGKSRQDEVDAAEELINNAVENLEKVVFEPCDYTVLDEAIAQADEFSESFPENDGRYKPDAWQNFLDAVEDAKNVDRDLTDENLDNQDMIDQKALTLAEAISALGEPENQYSLVDTTYLQDACDIAVDRFGVEYDNRYDELAWNEYMDAVVAGREIINNPPYDDDEGVGRQIVEDATNRIIYAVAALHELSGQNYIINVTDEDDNLLTTILVNKASDATFEEIKDQLPEITPPEDERYEFVGWADGDGNILTDDTVITDDMTIKPVFEIPAFIPDDDATVTVEKDGDVTYVGTEVYNSSVDGLISQFVSLADAEYVVYRNGAPLTENMTVRTGDRIQCIDVNTNEVLAEAIVVLYGDVNGDGAVDAFDAIKIDVYNSGIAVDMSGAYGKAADMNADGGITSNDYSIVQEYVVCNGDIHRGNGRYTVE